jgi:hypothetical protein
VHEESSPVRVPAFANPQQLLLAPGGIFARDDGATQNTDASEGWVRSRNFLRQMLLDEQWRKNHSKINSIRSAQHPILLLADWSWPSG